ncbi:MAG: nitrilase-related carbon-nitrogen hydrolase, partial [bacterium]
LTPVLCYEVLFPDLVARRRTPDSLAIANLADDSWVESERPSRHLTNIARFRAIEQRLPLVRVAHGGLSAVVDPFGRLIETLPRHTYAAHRVALHSSPPPAVRERAAIFALPVAAFAVVGCALRKIPFARRTGGTP